MNKQALTDGSDRWFDLDNAIVFRQRLDHSGAYSSHSADSPYIEHEELYRISSSEWILHTCLEASLMGSKWKKISKLEAAIWLKRNGHRLPSGLPAPGP